MTDDGSSTNTHESRGGEEAVPEPAPVPLPERIGRYRVERILGKGTFGLVYLAQDEKLERAVAVKVPRKRLVNSTADAEPYLAEARAVASVDHPNIVPVYDVGSVDGFPCFIVSKYIDGASLLSRIRERRINHLDAARLIVTVAEALHHAHKQGLVHRDIKPGNIIIDRDGTPFVVDFGLALREQEVGKASRHAGTPAYMSPEQARGEGHRVDGRSDIFSLGVVFYRLLVDRLPFQDESREEVLEKIVTTDPKPPRQIDDAVPKELERICLKCLSKRATDRYTTAKDLAEDLKHFLKGASQAAVESRSETVASAGEASKDTRPADETSVVSASWESQLAGIIPKGLRAFDEHDADFFLDLLPGPRDRDGLPAGIRFWKTRLEETVADRTFSVGLIYGPSGCGKSSLVRAGLLTRLAEHVVPVYVEATPNETETRLLTGLLQRCPALPSDLSLPQMITAIRQGWGIHSGTKLVLVIDQFEQWLHAKQDEEHAELVQALRQCHGSRVQCLVVVRDDFWMAATRFMRELEIPLVEGQNSYPVDLFSRRHARRVMAAFGRAFGDLPYDTAQMTGDQKRFLKQAVDGLAKDGMVICVRLALFAEMMKGKPWVPASLREVGGTEGVGVSFLQETFSGSTAPPEHRRHQKAARSVLKALLPPSGANIKGHMRSREELRTASGYEKRSADFREMMRILDSEVRLITPTDPEGIAEELDEPSTEISQGEKYYQLTHDYLVPAVREWLTRKQRETHRGRAELLLAERADLWKAKQEARQLPSALEWINAMVSTRHRDWSEHARKMMRAASWRHVGRGFLITVVAAIVICIGLEVRGRIRAAFLCDKLLHAKPHEILGIVDEMKPHRRRVTANLIGLRARGSLSPGERTRVSLALLPVRPSERELLLGQLLEADPSTLRVIREALLPDKEHLTEGLWTTLENDESNARRLRAACALAAFDPANSAHWKTAASDVASVLASQNPTLATQWGELLSPVRDDLESWLVRRLEQSGDDRERSVVAGVLAEHNHDRPKRLRELIPKVHAPEVLLLADRLPADDEQTIDAVKKSLEQEAPSDSSETANVACCKRMGNLAMALFHMDRHATAVDDVFWPLLRPTEDATLQTYLIHSLIPSGIDQSRLIQYLKDHSTDCGKDAAGIRQAIILSLGDLDYGSYPPIARDELRCTLAGIYVNDPDAGVHSAVRWLFQRWRLDKRLKELEARIPRNYRKDFDWYLNSQDVTMVVIRGPVTFQMGSSHPEDNTFGVKAPPHKRTIEHTYAISATEITFGQFFGRFPGPRTDISRVFEELFGKPLDESSDHQPARSLEFAEIAEYCRELTKREFPNASPRELVYSGDSGETAQLPEDYSDRIGYRLPTEAEWECACRGGTRTDRFFGDDQPMLQRYAWFRDNSVSRIQNVGRLRPNRYGLFDVYGNAAELCYACDYPGQQATQPLQDRGGTYGQGPERLRSSTRRPVSPSGRWGHVGFRIVCVIRSE